MRIHLLGTRGSLPTPDPDTLRYGGNTSCVAISHDGELPSLILDAGTGLANAGRLFGDRSFQGSILLGHLHWDHIYGLPFFRPGDLGDARVDLYVPGSLDPAAALRRAMSPPIFPIDVQSLRGSWRLHTIEPGERQIEGFEILAAEIPHKGGRTLGFRVSDSSGAVAYLSDHSPTSLGPGPTGNGELHAAAMALAADVDLLIHDSQYTPDEFEQRPDWGHCSYEYPLELAAASKARRTLLFHHDPGRTDDDLDALAQTLSNESASFAVEGTTIVIDGVDPA